MEIWKFIHENLGKGKKVALITIIDSKGSSPGKTGFKMAITGEGKMAGSIGGGTAEYKMVELAKKKLSTGGKEPSFAYCYKGMKLANKALDSGKEKPFIKRLVHDADAEEDKSGMICSGEQTQAFVFLDKKDMNTIKKITASYEKGEKGVIEITPNGLRFQEGEEINEKYQCTVKNEEEWLYKEMAGNKETIYIFGGGHVSLELSKIMKMLDFRIVVYDNRDALASLEKNNFAHSKKIIDYKNATEQVPVGDHNFVVIMTVAHKHDLTVLKQMLRKDLKYLGMMSSKGKLATIHELLIEDGFTNDEIAKVDSPIGIPIKSKTPAEIAVSIAAKIIEVRNTSPA